METIKLSIDRALGCVTKENVYAYAAKAEESVALLESGKGKGNDFLGWLHLPSSISDAHLNDIEDTAKSLSSKCDIVVVIGIGGSYLGAKAVIDALSNTFDWM